MNETRHGRAVVAFDGSRKIAEGSLSDVARAAKIQLDADERTALLVFDATTSRPVELDLRGSVENVLKRIAAQADAAEQPAAPMAAADAPKRPGRPKLGVVAREVTLLPRHWEWLASQPGSASVTLRKLVEKARLASTDEDRMREARDSTYRFMFASAGNEPGFEEASRALFAGDRLGFEGQTAGWPQDVRTHARRLAEPAFDPMSARD